MGTTKGARRLYRRSAAVLAALLLTAASVGLTRADPYAVGYDYGAGYYPDSSLHTYCLGFSLINANLDEVVVWAMNNSLAPTDMNVAEEDPCVVNSTDVWWFHTDLEPGFRGQWYCDEDPGPNFVCYLGIAELDKAEINIGPNDLEDQKKTACHELGHSVGLQHGDFKTDCMINGEIPNTDGQWRHYNDHHKDHINATF